ncbi:MAG: 50S ribosomal protein L3 [Phascolarctobacterium sp.]|nr:50S ribosomal protein L3 [Candidatus Phascolarctobacterium caballi]
MAKAIIGKKLGMTQVFAADGKLIPVTVVEAGPCVVLQVKNVENDGYNAAVIGFGEVKEKHVTKPMAGVFAKAGVKAVKWLRELRSEKAVEYKVGDQITCDIFAEGDVVDALGISRGKGFAGAVKRYHFGRGLMKHGSKSHREPGSMGPRYSGPGGRVMPGKRLPGHMGVNHATVQHLKVVRVDKERNLLLVKGGIPGAAGTCVTIRETIKPIKPPQVQAKKAAKK